MSYTTVENVSRSQVECVRGDAGQEGALALLDACAGALRAIARGERAKSADLRCVVKVLQAAEDGN